MPFPRLRPGVTHSSSSWSLGRKIGAVLAFVIGGVVAGASGIMLFAPETPGAFALAPLPAKEPLALEPVAVVATEAVEAPSVVKSDSLDRCQRTAAAACEDAPKADQAKATPTDGKSVVALAPATTTPVPDDSAKPVAAASPTEASPPVASLPSAAKSPVEAALPAIFMVPRAIASVPQGLTSTMSSKSIPAIFLASRTVASTPHQLVSTALPALASSPRPVVTTTAVALPGPKVADAPEAAAAPTKPRKAARTQHSNQRRYANDYYRPSRQNFFSFFFR